MSTETAALLLENQKTKFRCINRVYDMTKELEKNLEDGDIEALELTVESRQKQIEVCLSIDLQNDALREKLTDDDAVHFYRLTHIQEEEPEFRDETEKELYSMTVRIAAQLQRTREHDKEFTGRFAGKKPTGTGSSP